MDILGGGAGSIYSVYHKEVFIYLENKEYTLEVLCDFLLYSAQPFFSSPWVGRDPKGHKG